MKSAMLLVVFSIAAFVPAALSAPYAVYEVAVPVGYFEEALEDWQPELQEAVPVRVRRQLSASVDTAPGGGARVGVQGNTNVWQGQDSRVDANGHYARTFGGAGGPPTYGGGLSYQQPRGGASVDVSRTPGFGTQVSAQGNANLWRSNDRMSSLDANARWSRNYGSPWGTSRPDYGAGLTFTHRF
nr:attacin-like 1 c-1315 [Carausius morosus]